MSCMPMGDNPLPPDGKQVVIPLRWKGSEEGYSFLGPPVCDMPCTRLEIGFCIGFDSRAYKVTVRPGSGKSALVNLGSLEEYL